MDGSPYVSQGAVTQNTNLQSTNISITLTNGATGTSFVEGDTYLFSTPGSWITSQGANEEASSPPGNNALATRCRDRWSTLSLIPTNNFYDILVRSVPTVGSQVTQVIALPDTVINNKVNIIVAGPQGALPSSVVSTIQAYVSPRVPITDLPVVSSPSLTNVTLAGTITVTAAQLSTAETAILASMTNYVGNVGINGVVRLAKIIELLMEIGGVIDVSGMTINGAAANLQLGTSSTFFVTNLQTLQFSYITV